MFDILNATESCCRQLTNDSFFSDENKKYYIQLSWSNLVLVLLLFQKYFVGISIQCIMIMHIFLGKDYILKNSYPYNTSFAIGLI